MIVNITTVPAIYNNYVVVTGLGNQNYYRFSLSETSMSMTTLVIYIKDLYSKSHIGWKLQ